MSVLLRKGESVDLPDACECDGEYDSVNEYAEFLGGSWRCRRCHRLVAKCRSLEPLIMYELN